MMYVSSFMLVNISTYFATLLILSSFYGYLLVQNLFQDNLQRIRRFHYILIAMLFSIVFFYFLYLYQAQEGFSTGSIQTEIYMYSGGIISLIPSTIHTTVEKIGFSQGQLYCHREKKSPG